MIKKRKALFVLAILMIVGTSVGFIIKADAKSIHLNKTKVVMQVGVLPMDVEVENYGSNEKIFYPEKKIATKGGKEGSGKAGDLALFSPWGNVVMYYGDFSSYPGLYHLGEAESGSDKVKKLSGKLHIEVVE